MVPLTVKYWCAAPKSNDVSHRLTLDAYIASFRYEKVRTVRPVHQRVLPMLLIEVIGPVGSGKSSLLSTLAVWWRQLGKEPEGFIAPGHERTVGTEGAARYDIVMVKSGTTYPFALRDNARRPPYRFDEATASALDHWAAGLSDAAPPSLVIIDEFGSVEASGGGHMRLWKQICSSHPDILVVAVRKGLEDAIHTRIGRRPDVVIDAASRDAWIRLNQACVAHSDWMRVGLYGGGAGGFEASVGAILHGTQIPLRGLFLSSMQSVIMTFAADGLGHRRRVVWVSFLAASLKALSPTGNRLRPMMAISLQGILYTIAITLLGWNFAGVAIGGFLVGAWSAIQGVALQYLFVGNELLRAYDSIIQWVARRLDTKPVAFLALVVGWTILCGLVSGTFTLIAWNRRQKMPGRIRDIILKKGRKGIAFDGKSVSFSMAMKHGMRDIARPLFWLPVAIVVTVMFLDGSGLESILWVVIRAAGVGFVLFSIVRALDVQRFIGWLRSRGHWGPALAYQKAIDRVNEGKATQDDKGTHRRQ